MKTFIRIAVFIIGAILITPIGIFICNPDDSTFNKFLYWAFVLNLAVIWGWSFVKSFPENKNKK